jgi:predicted nucleic acid-binding protein
VAVSIYLDASVLIALFTEDPHSERADAFLQSHAPNVIVSDFAAAEFASVVARFVRTAELTAEAARQIFTDFDAWIARSAQSETTTAADVSAAESFLRRLDLTLRTPDAVHIAIAQRFGAALATFDNGMGSSAEALGLATQPL